MIAIVGKPQLGKSTLLKHLILLSPAQQVFLLDYHAEFGKISTMRPNVFLAYDWRNIESFKDKVLEAADRAAPSLVIFDEIHMYTKTHRENVDQIAEIYRMAGHHGIFLLCATHRIYDLPPDLRAMITEFIFFKITLPNDLKYIKDNWDEAAAVQVRRLRPFHFIRLTC